MNKFVEKIKDMNGSITKIAKVIDNILDHEEDERIKILEEKIRLERIKETNKRQNQHVRQS